MTERYVAVVAGPSRTTPPPGIDREDLRLALLEDTYEVVADMARVTPVLALCPPDQPKAEAVTWPGTPILRVRPRSDGEDVLAVLEGLADLGADEGTVIAGDAPDLPILLLGKLHRGLARAEAAICPAAGGGLVAIAARLPPPPWFVATRCGLDTHDALERLRSAAPSRRALSVGPGWRRVRGPGDVSTLDPGLEGWEATRALLSGDRLP
ncbi:MAG: DUF2064 domain-containing protein [Streptosporangiaceae bacterium]